DVDDVSGELLGNFIDQLNKEKILDVQIVPSFTKKNRPSHIIKVLCLPDYTFELIEKIIHELGTLGVRFNTLNRVCVDRVIEKQNLRIKGRDFEVRFKISYIIIDNGREIINIKPEYEDIKKISEKLKIPLKTVEILAQGKLEVLYHEYNKLKPEE
ncbi:MAG: nickel insertion protein, partial [Candidatus Thorarchaeota archaeon]